MVPAGNKAKRLSLVNHTTKTIHHHHHHQVLFELQEGNKTYRNNNSMPDMPKTKSKSNWEKKIIILLTHSWKQLMTI